MKKIFYYLIIAAAATSAAACMRDPIVPEEEEVYEGQDTETQPADTASEWTLIVEAAHGNDALTKALQYNESNAEKPISFTWAEGDKVDVYFEKLSAAPEGGETVSSYVKLGTLTPKTYGTSSAPLTGGLTLAEEITAGSFMSLWYISSSTDYAEQDGTLSTLSSKYDFAVAKHVKVNEIDRENKILKAETAKFESSQAILAFQFRDAADQQEPLAVKQLTISAEGESIVAKQSITESGSLTTEYGSISIQKTAENTEPMYVALRLNASEQATYSFTFTAETNITTYRGKATATLENGKFYPADIMLDSDIYGAYNLAGEDILYYWNENQIHILYAEDTVYFRILDPEKVRMTEIGKIPQNAELGDSFTVEVSTSVMGVKAWEDKRIECTVTKREDDKLWLESNDDSGTSFIVSK